MRSACTARMLCLLGAILLAPGMARAQQEERAATSVPAGAVAYLSVDLVKVQEFWTQVKDSTLVKAIQSLLKKGDKPADAAVTAEFLMALPGQVLDGPAVVALADEKVAPGAAPSVVVSLPIKNQEQMKGILTLLETQLKARKMELATREYEGVTITTVAVPDPKVGQPSYALLADRLVIASRPQWLEKALDATAGRAPRLAEDPRFERVRALIAAKPAGAAWFWIDPARIQSRVSVAIEDVTKKPAGEGQPAGETADKPAGEGQPAAKPKLPVSLDALKPMMEAYESAGGRLDLSTEGIGVDGFYTINAQNEFGKKILALKGAPLRSAGLVSGTAILYAGFNNLPFLVEMTQGILAAAGGNVQEMLGGVTQTVQTATGLDLKKDVFDYVGTEAALAINEMAALDVSSIPALLYLQTTNTPGLGKTMQKLRARLAEAMGIKFIRKDLPQGRIYHMSPDSMPIPIAPGWTFAGDFLVVGATPAALKSPLFLAKGTGAALAANPSFQRAVAAAGGGQTLWAMFLNLSRLAAFADKLPAPKKDGAPAVDPAQAKQILEALGSLSAVGTVQHEALAFRIELGANLKN